MKYTLPPLPYAHDALEPFISADSLRLHHDVLQQRYVDRLNALVTQPVPLQTLIRDAPDGPILNNAAQIWNHTFLWSSMKPGGSGRPSESTALGRELIGWDGFEETFVTIAVSVFGSGYVWVLRGPGGGVDVWGTPNGGNPLRELPQHTPLLTCDVWEHAYLLDYGADRATYARVFLRNLANWDYAAANYAAVS